MITLIHILECCIVEFTINPPILQVKPLLEVTKQEEKLTQKEDELKLVRERLETQVKRCHEYEHKFQQASAEKTQLAEQLQVTSSFPCPISTSYDTRTRPITIYLFSHYHCIHSF